MATLKIGTRTHISVNSIELKDYDNEAEKLVIINNNEIVKIKAKRTKIEVNGSVNNLIANNVAYINGEVLNAKVSNCLYVDGIIRKFNNTRNSIQYDRNLTFKNKLQEFKRHSNERSLIIHINGDLNNLIIKATNIELLPLINGNVAKVNCGNCLVVKGDVAKCEVGNMIFSNMGVKPDRKIEKKRREYEEQQQRQMNEAIDNLFKGIFN